MQKTIELDYKGQTPQQAGYFIFIGETADSGDHLEMPDAVGVLLPDVDGDFFVYHNTAIGVDGAYVVSEGLTGTKIVDNTHLWIAIEEANNRMLQIGAAAWEERIVTLDGNISPRYLPITQA